MPTTQAADRAKVLASIRERQRIIAEKQANLATLSRGRRIA